MNDPQYVLGMAIRLLQQNAITQTEFTTLVACLRICSPYQAGGHLDAPTAEESTPRAEAHAG
jgi:hypothetical protein